MGLDMYLNRSEKVSYKGSQIHLFELDNDDVMEEDPDLYAALKPYEKEISYVEEVGYWRKANAIHRWFVDNVQGGKDDCESYLVKREQLEELLEVCEEVKDSCTLIPAKVCVGYRYEHDEQIPMMEDGMVIADSSVAEELLPTIGGFFFGRTDYDEWYYKNIEHTINVIEEVLATTDFDQYEISYHASW